MSRVKMTRFCTNCDWSDRHGTTCEHPAIRRRYDPVTGRETGGSEMNRRLGNQRWGWRLTAWLFSRCGRAGRRFVPKGSDPTKNLTGQ